MKYLLWLLSVFLVIPLSVPPPALAEEPPMLEEQIEPPMLEEGDDRQTALQKKMKELHLAIPYTLATEIKARLWIAWRMVVYKIAGKDEPVAYVIQFLSIADNDRYFAGEEYRGKMLRAEAVFCHKHRRLSHFIWWDNGHWKVIKMHDKTGVT